MISNAGIDISLIPVYCVSVLFLIYIVSFCGAAILGWIAGAVLVGKVNPLWLSILGFIVFACTGIIREHEKHADE